MASKYEMTMVLPAELSDEDQQDIIDEISGWIDERDGEIESHKVWGSRQLAYDLQGHSVGIYVTFFFEMEGENLQSFREEMDLKQNILRYLIISLDKEGLDFEDVKDFPETETEAG